MKEVILSADGFRYVYSVPDKVAENLYEYCIEFCKWLNDSPDAKKFRRKTKTGTSPFLYGGFYKLFEPISVSR